MNYLLDLIILAIIAITLVVYYRRGFVKAVFGFGKALFAFLLSAAFGKTLGAVLAEKFFDERIYESIHEKISAAVEKGAEGISESIPPALKLIAGHCGVDVDGLAEGARGNEEWVNEVSHGIAEPISSIVSALIGYLAVFAVSYLLLLILSFVLNKLFRLPVLNTLNKILGLVLGIFSSVVFAVIFVYAASFLIYYTGVMGDSSQASGIIEKTYIFKYIAKLTDMYRPAA